MMKKLLTMVFICTLHSLMAQEIYRSTIEDFKSQLQTNKATLVLYDGTSLSFNINDIAFDENARVYHGYLLAPQHGGITVKVDHAIVEGEILDPYSSQSWKISTVDGWVIISQSNIEKQICVEAETNRPEIDNTYKQLRTKATIAESRKLQSNPSGKAVIYIDFDGATVNDTWWKNNYNNGNSWYATPANISADNEITVWKVMSEDYRPFNVNVTTDSSVFFKYPATERQRIIVTRNTSWQTVSTTGIGRIGGFGYFTSGTEASPCFSFPGGFTSNTVLTTTQAEKLGEVSSHEVGHAFGLTHDGDAGTNYYAGHGYWAPIMGSGYNRVCTQWSKGEYTGANNTQDDLAIITNSTNGFGYRTDDYGNNYNTASLLSVVGDSVKNLSIEGIIEKSSDVDAFKFSVNASSNVNLVFKPFETKPNLDVKVSLYKADNTLVTSNDVAGAQNATLSTTIPAGDYYILVEGVGYGSPLNTGYSDYASIGYYKFYGVIPNATSVVVGNLLPNVNITSPVDNASVTSKTNLTISVTATDTDGNISKVEFYNGSTLLSAQTSAPFTYVWPNITAGSYVFTAKAYDNENASTVSNIVNVTVKDSVIYACSAAEWNASTVYLGDASKGAGNGEVVSYQGKLYRAKYWTQNNIPAAGGAWLDLGACEVVTDVDTHSNVASLTFYPNPANGIIYFTASVEGLQLVNALGELIPVQLQDGNCLDISNLPQGIYVMMIKNQDAVVYSKLLKQ